MKKVGIVGLIIVVALGIGWSAFWYIGKGIVEQRVNVEVARVQASGWEVVWSDIRLTGFPLEYRVEVDTVAATKTSTGLLIQLPKVIGEGDVFDPSRITFTLPESFAASLPIPEIRRRGSNRLPPVVKLSGTSRDFKLITTTPVNDVRKIDATATAVSLKIDQEDYALKIALALEGVTGSLDQSLERNVQSLAAGTIDLKIENPDSQSGLVGLDLSSNAFSSTISTTLGSADQIQATIYQGAEGTLELAFQTGALTANAMFADDPATPASNVALSAISGTGIAAIENGAIDIRSELRDSAWDLSLAAGAVPYRGGAMSEVTQFRYQVPMSPTDDPKPGAVRLALLTVKGDEALWGMLDPEEKLGRDPASLVVDLEGTLRVTDRIDQLLPGAPPPYEISNVIVKEVTLDALGASAKATGDIEILQPIQLPLGEVNVTMNGMKALIDELSGAGLLTEEMRVTAEALLEVYARPLAGEDAWQTDVTFENNGIFLNGLPVPEQGVSR